MKFQKEIFLALLIFLSFSEVKAQKTQTSPNSPVAEDDKNCVIPERKFVEINFSVWNSKGFYVKDLTYKDFKIFERKKLLEAEYFKYDELKNQYTLDFGQEDLSNGKVKIKIKLSKEKQKQFGKVFVKRN